MILTVRKMDLTTFIGDFGLKDFISSDIVLSQIKRREVCSCLIYFFFLLNNVYMFRGSQYMWF